MEKHIVESINQSAIAFMCAFSDAAQKAASAITEFGQAFTALDGKSAEKRGFISANRRRIALK